MEVTSSLRKYLYGNFDTHVSLILGFCPGVLFAVLNGALHVGVDYVTFRLIRQTLKNDNFWGFWAVVKVDQLIHQICLLLILNWLV